ncbi:MAG TPA: site-2 protease family protein [Terriglobales bacterium]|nr:site-2 protease family protein [Terriglobales bacterium]
MPRDANRRLGRVAGIDIQFHSSWIIILALIGLTLGEYFRAFNPGWSDFTVAAAAIVTTILFFVSVVLHELAHSLVARAHGLPVHAITLFVFGGVSELTREPDDAITEFKIAIAGPLLSLVLAGICLGLGRLGGPHAPVAAVLNWLGYINLVLAIFNLIPGFPLDGGRVLRAILWSANKNFLKSTRWATRVGKLCALAFILYGVLEFFQGAALSGLWLAFIGWFLLSAAEQSWRATAAQTALAKFTVGDLGSPFFPRVAPDVTLEHFIEELAHAHNYRASLVMDDDDHLLGILTAADLNRIPRAAWATTRVADVMVPRAQMATVEPTEGLVSALQKMTVNNVGQLPILAGGAVQGVVKRDRILELLHQQMGPANG